MTSRIALFASLTTLLPAFAIGCSDDEASLPVPITPTTTTTSTSGGGGTGGATTTSAQGGSGAEGGAGGMGQGGGTGGMGGSVGDCSTSADCRGCCAMAHPEGSEKAVDFVSEACFCGSGAPCETECANDCPVSLDSMNLSQACETCVVGTIFNNDACLAEADTACSQDTQCAEATACLSTCPQQ